MRDEEIDAELHDNRRFNYVVSRKKTFGTEKWTIKLNPLSIAL